MGIGEWFVRITPDKGHATLIIKHVLYVMWHVLNLSRCVAQLIKIWLVSIRYFYKQYYREKVRSITYGECHSVVYSQYDIKIFFHSKLYITSQLIIKGMITVGAWKHGTFIEKAADGYVHSRCKYLWNGSLGSSLNVIYRPQAASSHCKGKMSGYARKTNITSPLPPVIDARNDTGDFLALWRHANDSL